MNATRLFATHINAAPEEDLLETFAESLGASRISLIVKNSHSVSRASTNPTPASEELRDLLLERTFLFLHERQRASDRDVVRGSDWLNKHFRCIEVLKLDIVSLFHVSVRACADFFLASFSVIRWSD